MALGLVKPTEPMEQFIRGDRKTINRKERVFLSAMVRRLNIVRAQSQCSGQVLGVLSFHLQWHDG